MRLQHISVMFVMIFIPIILVTSYFISLQVNTVKLESEYTEKLLDATYDAMTAFELNTANEDLSTVSDSLRSIIDASNNIFFNTLCTNLGVSNASKSYIQPYIPAILYTLYDGYYIYSPTNIPEICVDTYGRTIRTNDLGVKYLETVSGVGIYEFSKDNLEYASDNPEDYSLKPGLSEDEYGGKLKGPQEEYGQVLYKNNNGSFSTTLHSWGGAKTSATYQKSTYYKRDYILKSYIPYSATYSVGNKNLTINFTLDNFMTIEGKIDNVYYTKSGYFIDSGLVQQIKVSGGGVSETITSSNWMNVSEEHFDEMIYAPETYNVTVTLTGGITISNRDGAVDINNPSGPGTVTQYWDDAQSAVQYYVDSFMFSQWIYANLGTIKAEDLKNAQYSVTDIQKTVLDSITKDTAGNDIQTNLYRDMLYNFEGDKTCPFSSTNNNPESEESIFYKHKRNVIKNSITYNLILSMLVYTEESRTVEFNMPSFKETEWNQILNNVSITAFMEGMRCGLKYYNNYAIVTSTNNEITVTENEIYYVPRVRTESGKKYLNNIDDNEALDTDYKIAHRIDCDDLDLIGTYGAISFKAKEVKYDKILDNSGKFIYDHKVYTDYDCIVDSNYTVGSGTDGNTDVLGYLTAHVSEPGITEKLQAYRIAIAKERNNLYKTTAFVDDYGWQVIFLGDSVSSGTKKGAGTTSVDVNLSSLSIKELKHIKKIEVTIEGMKIEDASGKQIYGVYTDAIKASFGTKVYDKEQTISTTSSSRRTLEFEQDFSDGNAATLTLKTTNQNTQFTVEAVKVYYK